MPSAKNWVFTLNNYTETNVEFLSTLFDRNGDATADTGTNAGDKPIQYLCFGREVGVGGTPHLQGYVSFRSRRTRRQVATDLGLQRAHIEVARGSPRQNIDYCQKDGAFLEFGEAPAGAGSRSDLLAVQELLAGGSSVRDIAESHFGVFLRYQRALRQYADFFAEVRNWPTEVRVYWGASGAGKTRAVYAEFEQSDVYSHPGSVWFDGYEGQKVVLFDDFGGSEFKITYLLKLLDRYPMRVPIKGAFAQWVPRFIILTSNHSPDEWYPNAKPMHVRAMKRRFTEVRHFMNPTDDS